MKNKFKKIVLGLGTMAMLIGITGCSSGGTAQGDKEITTVGVIQYATHPSLDNCYTGFVEGLAEGGYVEGENLKIDMQNAQGDQANADLIAKNMVSKKYNLITGIATPAAMAAYSASKDAKIPVVFTAVSDPVAAGIVKNLESPGTNATGTSDILPLEEQIKMIRGFLPEAKKIGIIFTTSEPNSVSQLAKFKEIAPNYGFEVMDVGVTNPSEVAAATQTLISKGVNCINNFTDNNVVDNLSTVLNAASIAKIPVFGSEEEQVKNGCLASQSIDYVALGKETGKMAAEILKGEAQPETMPVHEVTDCTPIYNEEVMKTLGLSLPQEYKDAIKITK